jgi:hypothetical protein
MKAKKVLSFLLLAPAFNSKNLTSILLVVIFFLLYCAAGGKVSWVPDVQRGGGFGSIDVGNVTGDVTAAGRASAAPAVAAALPAAYTPAALVQPVVAATPAAGSEESNKLDALYERLKRK